MHVLKHQPWINNPTPKNMATEVEWNMWTQRAWPFNHLTDGDTVVCVSGGGPAHGTLMFEARVGSLIRAPYADHEEAWRLLSNGIPLTTLKACKISRSGFLNHEYTVNAPGSGWLLAWSSTPLRWLGLPRPVGFRFRPNGWGELQGPL